MAAARKLWALEEDQTDLALLSVDEVRSFASQHFVGAPPPWDLIGGSRGYLEVSFVDLADPAAADIPPPPWGDLRREYKGSIPIAEETRFPVFWEVFGKNRERLYVHVAPITTPLIRTWADCIMAERTPQRVPLGRGFVGGPTAAVDAGDRLVRATYSDGVDPRSLDQRAMVARHVAVQERAAELLMTL